jgi:hypothetical protein
MIGKQVKCLIASRFGGCACCFTRFFALAITKTDVVGARFYTAIRGFVLCNVVFFDALHKTKIIAKSRE